ncbi:MAG: hypothetical protein C0502_08980 [Opitutus sp.]|nr:hypothetical protein [Opitutus sp.]
MNTLNHIELAEILGGAEHPSIGDPTPVDPWIEWAYEQFLSQLRKQAEEAERKAWQEFMSTQAA